MSDSTDNHRGGSPGHLCVPLESGRAGERGITDTPPGVMEPLDQLLDLAFVAPVVPHFQSSRWTVSSNAIACSLPSRPLTTNISIDFVLIGRQGSRRRSRSATAASISSLWLLHMAEETFGVADTTFTDGTVSYEFAM